GIWTATGLGAAGDLREGSTTARFGYTYYTFFKNGRVLRDLPPEGLLSFKQRFWAQHFVGRFGRYEVRDDAVLLTFPQPGKASVRETLQRRGADLARGETTLTNVLCDEAVLEGTFLRAEWRQLGAYYDKGITFAPDGHFSDLGINSTVNIGWWLGGDCTMRDPTAKPGKGTWRVKSNTLELLYEDGRRRRFGFHLYGDESKDKPKAIVLNGNVLVRRE
ncbi:MAG: hypothetical protein KDC48_02190, partial [Planctomycetes bacterium]|nr:hypothetical protein [Planctomycetota bacterium]